MRCIAIVLPLVILAAGCQKTKDAAPSKDEKPNIVGNGGGNLSVGGGGGGAAQAVRKAAARTVNLNELHQLQIMIAMDMATDPTPPGADQIKKDADPKLAAMIKDEVIILTNTRKSDGIYAYTKWPQRGGKHYVVKNGGVDEQTPADLTAALKAQGSEVILEK